MNFFEAQDRSRRRTRWLVVMFMVATLLIVAATTVVIEGFIGGFMGSQPGGGLSGQRALMIAGAVLTCILLASAFRVAQLGSGGARIAQEMGGTLVSGETQDLQRRRLLNVVEEMAIASGVPVPQVFVMEHEAGINAFAAGFTTADAAVAVTRGALDQLNRAELQGVIAHEFSHILNGDMRLNLRLVGILFGIIMIGQVGRMMMHSSRGVRISRNSRREGNSAALIGIALFVVGAIGVLMARLIRAGVSRQREYLADASAVQFTRQTEGIAGALAKIGAGTGGSRLTQTDGEQISHMLFARGAQRAWFSAMASHPPLQSRIRKIDPGLAERLSQAGWAPEAIATAPETAVSGFAAYGGEQTVALDTESITQRIGRPNDSDIAVAAGLRDALPATIEDAAHSPEWALYLVLALATSEDPTLRHHQFELLRPRIGEQRQQRTARFADAIHELGPHFRLPILELCFPALKERPSGQIRFLLELIDTMNEASLETTLGQYALRQLLEYSLDASLNPSRAARRTRHLGQSRVADAAAELIGIVAAEGHEDNATAAPAQAAGLKILGLRQSGPRRQLHDSDEVLQDLQGLIGRDLHRLLRALLATVTYDREVTLEEAEMMRLICAALGCPLPPMIAALALNR